MGKAAAAKVPLLSEKTNALKAANDGVLPGPHAPMKQILLLRPEAQHPICRSYSLRASSSATMEPAAAFTAETSRGSMNAGTQTSFYDTHHTLLEVEAEKPDEYDADDADMEAFVALFTGTHCYSEDWEDLHSTHKLQDIKVMKFPRQVSPEHTWKRLWWNTFASGRKHFLSLVWWYSH